MHVLHPSSDDARKKHNTPIASFINQSITRSLARSSFANLFVIRRVRKIARHRRHRVGRRKRPTHRESSSITSRHRTTNQRITSRAHHPSPITDRRSHRIASHPGMTCTRRARSPARPMVSANHRTARTLAGDASTPTIHARVDMSTTRSFLFSLSFFRPLSVDAVSRDGCLPSSRVVDSSLSDATTRRARAWMNA